MTITHDALVLMLVNDKDDVTKALHAVRRAIIGQNMVNCLNTLKGLFRAFLH